MSENQTKQKERFVFQNLPNEKLSEKELIIILYNITGQLYEFASAANMRWGADGKRLDYKQPGHADGFYQLMPESLDDGFFDWYCLARTEYQFFKTREECTLHFINYWFQWKYFSQFKFVEERPKVELPKIDTPMIIKDLKELIAGANDDLPVSVFNGATNKTAFIEGSGVTPYRDPRDGKEYAEFTIVY